jgi:hypothetical protein
MSKFLKALANSTSYGIYAQMDLTYPVICTSEIVSVARQVL